MSAYCFRESVDIDDDFFLRTKKRFRNILNHTYAVPPQHEAMHEIPEQIEQQRPIISIYILLKELLDRFFLTLPKTGLKPLTEISFQMYTVRNYISCGSVSHTRSFVLDPFAETRTVTEFLEQFH